MTNVANKNGEMLKSAIRSHQSNSTWPPRSRKRTFEDFYCLEFVRIVEDFQDQILISYKSFQMVAFLKT